MAAKHTLQDLQELQALPLKLKIRLTQQRIREWVDHFGLDSVYVSFSGGKDSTVLMDICREMYPSIKAMFVDVPTQYPELREFVKTYDNVDIVRPKNSFIEVCEKYGFPLISKEVSECVEGARKYLKSIIEESGGGKGRYSYFYDKLCGSGKYDKSQWGGTIESIEDSEELANLLNERIKNRSGGNNQRLAIMLGWLTKDSEIKRNIPSEDRSTFSLEHYKYFLDSPFEISNQCCRVMKKEPAHRYSKETGRYPISAQMASESRLRTQKWMQNSCNAFEAKTPMSNPMSFWTEQDVLLYIRSKDLPICSVYGDIITDDEEMGQIDFMEYTGLEIFDMGNKPLHCTGCQRTGCVCCGFGVHLNNDTRFTDLKKTHPQMYKILDVTKNNGYTMREAIDWINEHGNLTIKY